MLGIANKDVQLSETLFKILHIIKVGFAHKKHAVELNPYKKYLHIDTVEAASQKYMQLSKTLIKNIWSPTQYPGIYIYTLTQWKRHRPVEPPVISPRCAFN
jgi:hypothetical protein